MPDSGPLEPGRMRVVVPERRAQAAADAGTWTLRSWPMPDPTVEAINRRRAEQVADPADPAEHAPEALFREAWEGCYVQVCQPGDVVPGGLAQPGLLTRAQMEARLRPPAPPAEAQGQLVPAAPAAAPRPARRRRR